MQKVCIELTDGRKMNFELLPEYAPITVANFVNLVKEKFYDGLCFHRVIKDFVIQGGGFSTTGTALKQKIRKESIKGEFKANGVENKLKHEPGILAMARAFLPDSASTQFYICVESLPVLDGMYATFGRATDEETVKVAVDISKVETHQVASFGDVPVEPVVIKTIHLIEE